MTARTAGTPDGRSPAASGPRLPALAPRLRAPGTRHLADAFSLVPRPVVDRTGRERLVREREERERVAQRHIVAVHVVAEGCLVVNEEKKYIDCVITETSPVRERRRGVVTASGAGVRRGQVQAEEVTVGDRRLREDVLVEVVGSENREHREDILGELA